MNNIKRFGVSLEKEIFEELNSLVSRHGFPNRSQALRFLIRNHLVEDAWKNNKKVAGCIVLIYDHHKKDVVNKSLDIQHDLGQLILSSQHVHLDHQNCIEVISLKGQARQLNKLADRLLSLKGIKHGKLVMTGV